MKNKLKAIFMSILLLASIIVPGLASVKSVSADETIPDKVNVTVHKRVFDSETPAPTQNTGNIMSDFGGDALPNVGFTVYDITDEYIKEVSGSTAEDATAALVEKYTNATPANVAADQKLTDKNGDVTFSGLDTKAGNEFKTYIILETKSPSAIVEKAAPIVLTMPVYAYDANGQVTTNVLSDIHVYPKNAENNDNYEGKISKELVDDTVHHHTNWTGLGAINDTVLSPRVGRLLQYEVTYHVPSSTIFAENSGIEIVDDPGVGIVLPEQVAVENGKVVDTIVDTLNADPATLRDNVQVKIGDKVINATVKYEEDRQEGGNSKFTLNITGADNADLAGETLVITYYAYLAKTESSLDNPVDNSITATADTTSGEQVSTDETATQNSISLLASRAAVVMADQAHKPLAVGGYNFKKVDAQSNAALAGAQFVVYDVKQKAYVQFNQDNAGNRTEQKWTSDINKATVYTSDEKGMIELEYLPYADYELVEVKAPEGYVKGGNVEFTVERDSYKTTKANPVEVKNAKKGLLPSTGGYGIYIFLLAGLALMAGAYAWFRRVNKNDNV
ncbi:SpaH/EbpB family LPXTG-anchored major pilin [Ligilactobacillus apodemi]|nr:SpaH/EbpB family LPXTG-anchored major pilin [Ligilactobacillus apodemi]